MKGLNDALCTTLAACGDVNRNVMSPPTPATNALVERVQEDAQRVSAALQPQTPAYHEIWVNGEPLKLAPEKKQAFEIRSTASSTCPGNSKSPSPSRR